MRKLPPHPRERLLASIAMLADNLQPPGATKLVGERTAWRIRVGEYRVIDDVVDESLTVTVVRPAHRRQVYRR